VKAVSPLAGSGHLHPLTNYLPNNRAKLQADHNMFNECKPEKRRFMKTNANSTATALEATDKAFERMMHKFFGRNETGASKE
jgi:hypothetical protein